ncbi:hypothetical protein DIPPA_23846 [Diplonema papillatum]|nr:hypothetical protein DIPPA_23846 [Diplonema papillatum]
MPAAKAASMASRSDSSTPHVASASQGHPERRAVATRLVRRTRWTVSVVSKTPDFRVNFRSSTSAVAQCETCLNDWNNSAA